MLARPRFCAVCRAGKQHEIIWVEFATSINIAFAAHFVRNAMVYLQFTFHDFFEIDKAVATVFRNQSALDFFG